MEVEDWHVLWRAIAGDNFADIPAEGSFVIYHPIIHVQQADNRDELEIPDSLLCRVTQVALLSRQYPECQIFVRFILTPVDVVEPEVGGYLHINEGGPVYERVASVNDLRRGSITVSANMANGLFVNTAHDVEMQVPFTYMREALPAEIKYKKKGNSRQLSAGWAHFLKHKEISVGDTFIFTRIHDNIVVGLRRRTPYNVPREMIQLAALSHIERDDFTVDYYPQAGDPVVTLIGGEDEEYEGEDEE